MPSLINQTLLNRYHVSDHIGRGGMAEVYKVWDSQRMTYLAMKVLHEDMAIDRVFMRRFKREGQTLEKLQHPHIVRFYGLEQQGPLAFMLLDFIEGKTLKRHIFDSGGPLSVGHVRTVMKAVCGALQYAHSLGLVHCDIKPGNIMIHQSGSVLLADFGISRMTDAATATMVGIGTPAYMAPEQVQGFDPVPQTDIYALGIVLYEMLTGGERPFTGEHAQITGTTSEKVRWEQVNRQPPPPRVYNPNISPQLEAVVLKCLAKEPEKRYASALDLLNAVETTLGPDQPSEPIFIPVQPEQQAQWQTNPDTFGGSQPVDQQGIAPPPQSQGKTFFAALGIGGTIIVAGMCLVGLVLGLIWFNNQNQPAVVPPVRPTTAVAVLDPEEPEPTTPVPTTELPVTTEAPVVTTEFPTTEVPVTTEAPQNGITISPTFTDTPSPTPSVTPSSTPTATDPLPASSDYDLAFASSDGHIYLMKTNDPRDYIKLSLPVNYNNAGQPTFCGDTVAAEVDHNNGGRWISMMEPKVGGNAWLWNESFSAGDISVPRCSPHGELIAFSAKERNESYYPWVFITNLKGDEVNGFYGKDGQTGYASWDNERNLVIIDRVGAEKKYQFIYFYYTDEIKKNMGYTPNRTDGDGGNSISSVFSPALSPTGNLIAFKCDSSICITDVNEETATVIPDTEGVGSCTWSKDGKWIYFSSNEEGDYDIYRIRPNGDQKDNLTEFMGNSDETEPAAKW